MKCLAITLITLIFAGCASNKEQTNQVDTADEEYRKLVKKYQKKLDLIWVRKFAENPNFGNDFDNCRNESEIAQWIEKHLSIEMILLADELKNEWSDFLVRKSIRFAEDRNLMDQALKNIEIRFRNDIRKAYALRHKYYLKQGLIKPG